MVSGREGISLKEADCLVNYNIDFSALSYWQSRDRMTTKDSIQNDVYWIFSEKGIEEKIYRAVTKKKDYTLKHFEKRFTKFINMKTMNSLSGGKTSSYVAVKYPADYNVFALVTTRDNNCKFPDKKNKAKSVRQNRQGVYRNIRRRYDCVYNV